MMLEKQKSGLLIAVATLVILLGATFWLWRTSAEQSLAASSQRFEFRNHELTLSIAQRLDQYEQLLISGAAFMEGSATVDRDEWRRYVQNLRLDERYPGIQGMGYAKVVQPGEWQDLEERTREQGYPEFEIWPEGDRYLYTTILYLEPENWRNQRAMGYDMFSEPARRQAMERARDSASVSATSTVELVQEAGVDQQPGFLLYYPLYQDGAEPADLAARREQLQGFVYGAFRLGDLMAGILGDHAMPYRRLEIFEGEEPQPDNRIFDSRADDPIVEGHDPLFTSLIPLDFNGANWILRFTSLPNFEASADVRQPTFLLIGGIIFSLLMAAFIWALWLNQHRSWALSRASSRLRQEASRTESLQEELRQFFSLSPDILCTINMDGTFRQVNAACERILGVPAQVLRKQNFLETVHPEDKQDLLASVAALKTKRLRRFTQELRNLAASGDIRWIEWSFVVAERNSVCYGYGRDITERKEMEQQLHHNAFHDKLTGVANRALLLDRLAHVLDRSRRFGESYAVLIMDIDNFKSINDSYGHGAGDKLLQAFAARVQQQLRPVDTCARFGGDEFTLLVEETSSEEAVRHLAERILAELQQVFVIDGYEFYISSSIGVAIGNRWYSYETAEQVLNHADLALYEAKRQGKGRYVVFDKRMQSEQLGRAQMEADLRQALATQNMGVFYQPIIDLRTGRIAGCEALVRWEHPVLGRVPPEKFIPVAESSGLITHLGRHVTETVCQTLAQWRQARAVDDSFFVNVNVSPRELFQRDSPEFLQYLLDKYSLEGRNLRVEVTEGVLIERSDEASKIFRLLQEMGVMIYIDDFGTGYSSLSYLRSLPVDGIKLDRSFLEQIRSTHQSREIARTVLELAKVLNLESVVEGVETGDQLDFVRSLGFGFAQGFGLHCPMPAVEMHSLMDSHRRAGYAPIQ